MSDNQILILQHISCEPAGAYEDELQTRGVAVVAVEVDEGEPLPDWRQFSAIVAMGGPMGAYEDSTYPWLGAEKRMIAEAAHAGHPVWGVCLGAQLLAASLGARVYRGEHPEVGIDEVSCTPESTADAAFCRAPKRFLAFQWHGDTFDLPQGATLLATSRMYAHQAFVYRRAYGLQFHLEVDTALATQWANVPAYAESLQRLRGPGATERLIADLADNASDITSLGRCLFASWLDNVVAPQSATRTAEDNLIGAAVMSDRQRG